MRYFKYICSLVSVLCVVSCSSKIKSGIYHLNYAYKGEKSNLVGVQDQELQVENDKVKLVIYENYIKPLDGLIQGNKIIFGNGDTLKYKKTKDGFDIYKADLVYVWVCKK